MVELRIQKKDTRIRLCISVKKKRACGSVHHTSVATCL